MPFRWIAALLLVASGAVCVPAVTAQTPPPYGQAISLEQANRVIAAAAAEADKHAWPVAIAVVDAAGYLVAFQRLENTQLGSVELAMQKAKTAALYRRPTRAFEETIAAEETGARVLKMPDVLPVEGGLPIVHEGKLIGAIGVSGVKPTDDGKIAAAGLAAVGVK
jgi:uncharacterized protein GlcG (DUF336 family)